MKEITNELLNEKKDLLLYIHTPFCGTCQIARKMLEQIEEIHKKQLFYEMNASLFPEFMQENKVESVPCLLIKAHGEIKERVYAFRSVSNMYRYIWMYFPEILK